MAGYRRSKYEGTRSSIGRSGEFFVMSQLELWGYYCIHSSSHDDDIWIKLPDDRIITVQVKTASERRRGRPSYQFQIGARSVRRADIYAFYAMDKGLILFTASDSEIVQKVSSSIKGEEFTEEAQASSLIDAIKKSLK